MSIIKNFTNSFNTNIKNGNLSKWASAIGKTAMSLGFMSIALKGNNGSHGCCHHNSSVFNGYINNGCGGYIGQQYTFGGIGISQHLLNYPMDILNTPMACQGGYLSNYGMLNNYINPYSFPVMQMMNNYPLNQNTQILDSNAPDAGKVDANQDTTKGKAFSEFIDYKNRINEQDELIDGSHKLFDKTDDTKEYITQMTDTAKSYAAFIDQSGNKDGYVTKEEYVAFKTKGITDATKLEQIKTLAENEFDKMNLNNNQYLDWKELGTMMAYMDSVDGKGNDSTITTKEFAQWHSQITDIEDTYRNNSKTIFKNLFSDQ